MEKRMLFTRQLGLVQMDVLQKMTVSLVGAGSLGSFITLTLTKMGVTAVEVFDSDGVTEHNLPNQFYRLEDISQFKTIALGTLIKEFSGVSLKTHSEKYVDQPLNELVIVATDSMDSRKLVWGQFKKQAGCKYFIEVRMGAQLGYVYSVTKSAEDIAFYEDCFPKTPVKPLPCTAKTIIYNVLMIASLVCRAVRAIANQEKEFPREMIFNMTAINEASFLVRR